MLLVGSKALQIYMPLNRVIHDWDFWMTEVELTEFNERFGDFKVKETPHSIVYDIHGTIVEVKSENQFEPTDHEIWHTQMFSQNEIDTQFGKCRVPDLQTIYDMKKATAECIDEWKHQYDIKLLESNAGDQLIPVTKLYQKRLKETQERVEKSKKNKFGFFHRNALEEQKIATIPEYIEHDYLHVIIADLMDLDIPTYQRITCADTDISKDQFEKLTYSQKISLMVEETLVLCLERWFIPQMIENGINYRLIDKFYNNNEASPTYRLLLHTNIKGLIGEADYIVNFARENFNIIEKSFFHAKRIIRDKNGFPKHLYDQIFDLRNRYRQGEKVGLHHAD